MTQVPGFVTAAAAAGGRRIRSAAESLAGLGPGVAHGVRAMWLLRAGSAGCGAAGGGAFGGLGLGGFGALMVLGRADLRGHRGAQLLLGAQDRDVAAGPRNTVGVG